jgi:hypothetical protein
MAADLFSKIINHQIASMRQGEINQIVEDPVISLPGRPDKTFNTRLDPLKQTP